MKVTWQKSDNRSWVTTYMGGVPITLSILSAGCSHIAYVDIGKSNKKFTRDENYRHLRSAKRGCIRMVRHYLIDAAKIIGAIDEYYTKNSTGK